MTDETYEDLEELVNELVNEFSWLKRDHGGEEKQELFRRINHLLMHKYASLKESGHTYISTCLSIAISQHAHELIETILSLPVDYTLVGDYTEERDLLRESLEDGNLVLFNRIAESIRVRNKRKQG